MIEDILWEVVGLIGDSKARDIISVSLVKDGDEIICA